MAQQQHKESFTDKEIHDLSKKIGSEWTSLMFELEYTKHQQDRLKETYKGIADRIRQMLLDWNRVVVDCGENARYLLAAAFANIDNNLMALEIVGKIEYDKKSYEGMEASEQTKERIKKIEFGVHFSPSNDSLSSNSSCVDGASPGKGGEPFKSKEDKTMDQDYVETLSRMMQSVGCVINEHGILGTCFRVGDSYVMTAYHVVKHLLEANSDKRNLQNVYVNFHKNATMPYQHQNNIFQIEESVHFHDVKLDVAVLKLKDTMPEKPFPAPFTVCKDVISNSVDRVALIGFGHPGSPTVKHQEPPSPLVRDGGERLRNALIWLRDHSEDIKNKLISVGKSPDVVDEGYPAIYVKDHILFDCFMEHGASGGPLIAKQDHTVTVVGMLLRGIPGCVFELPPEILQEVPPEMRFEVGAKMSTIYLAMYGKNKVLAANIFNQQMFVV